MQTITTQNHINKACTVTKTVWRYGKEESIAVTYLNREQIWPVRQKAIAFADSVLFGEPDCIREFDACLDRLNNLLGEK